MSLDLQAKLTLQTQEAEAGLDRVEGGLKQVGAAGQKAGASVQDGLGSRGVQHVRNFKGWLDKAALAAAALAAATTGALVSIKAIGDAINVTQAMSPVDNAAIEAANKALGGTVDKLTLMRQLQQTNLTADQFGPAAKAAAFMAKQFGFTKAHMLDAIHNGTLMETQLQALGISTKHLDNEVQRVAASFTASGGEVDEVTKSNIKARVTIEAIRKASKGWTADTRQAGDAAGKALAELKNVSLELGRAVLPALVKVVSATNDLFKWLKKIPKILQGIGASKALATLVDTFKSLGGLIQFSAKKIAAFSSSNSTAAKVARAAWKVGTFQYRMWGKVTQWTAGQVRQLGKDVQQLASAKPKAPAMRDIGKAIAEASKAADKLFAKEIAIDKQRAAMRQRAREEARRQALEVQQQLRAQAKDLTDNIAEKMMQVVADQGGAFGGVASAMTDVNEKMRIFGATAYGRKGMVAAAKVAAMFQGQQNVDLAHEVQLRAKELGLKGRSLHAAKLMAGWQQAGAKDTAEYLGNERAANIQLRAGLQLLQGSVKLGQLRVEQNNAAKDIQASMASAQSLLNAAIARRNELRDRGRKGDEGQIKTLDQQISRLLRTVGAYRTIGIERQRILAIAARHAKIELQIEKTEARRARAAEIAAANRAIRDQRAALNSARGGSNAVGGIQAQGDDKRLEILQKITEMRDQAKAAIQKLQAGGLNGDSSQKLLNQIAQQESLIKLKEKELSLVEKTTQAQLKGLSVTGQLLEAFKTDAASRAREIAQMAKSSFTDLVGGFAESMSNVVSGIIQGDKDVGANFGKATLEALGNLALKWGMMFALQGVGMLATYQPGGAVAIAAGAGLTALGIGLKGASGLIGPQTKSTGTGGTTGNAQPFQDRIPGTKTDDPKNVRETYILVNDVPWRGRGQARDFSDMIEWTKRGERMTGKRLAGV